MKKSKAKKCVKILVITAVTLVLLFFTAHLLINHFEQYIIDGFIAKIVKKSKTIHSIHYDKIDLNFFERSIRVENLSINGDEESGYKFKAVFPEIHIEGISIQKLVFNKLFYIKRLFIYDWEVIFPGEFYTLKAKELRFSKARSSIYVNLLELIPKHERYEFARKRGYRSNRMRLKIRSLIFRGIGFKDLFKNRKLSVKVLRIKKPQLDLFRNKNVPKRPNPREKKLPQQLLRELKFKLRIDNINISKGKITYSEHAKNEKIPGKISFSDIQADVKNVTNYPDLLEKKVSSMLTASTKLMDKSILKIKVTMPINDKQNRFKFSGSLGKIRLNEFKSMFENNAHIRINSGITDYLSFSAKADNRKAIGEMHFLYHHLKISVLKKGGNYKKKKFLSFLTNTIIFNSNPRSGKPVRIGIISYKPEKKLTIFNYMWESLLSGIKSSIGLRKSRRR